MFRTIHYRTIVVACTAIFCLTGCRPSPEALKEKAIQTVTAKNLEECIVGAALQNQRYVPGLEKMCRDEYEAWCKKCTVPLNLPFEKILRNGFFDSVETNVEMKTLQKSTNPLTSDDTVFRVIFNCKKKFAEGTLDMLFLFGVANTPEGSGVLTWQGTISYNGKEEPIGDYQGLLAIIGCINERQSVLINYCKKRFQADKANEKSGIKK